MPLQFPNARLFIHELLSDKHMTGAEAIVSSAYEYGLLPSGSLKSVEFSSGDQDCDCCKAANTVFKKSIELLDHGSTYDSAKVERAWKTILARVKKHRENGDGGQTQSTPDCSGSCSKLAPVLFDFLLQEVRRYS